MNNYIKLLAASMCVIGCLVFHSGTVLAQTDDDAIMIPRSYFCAGGMASYSFWNRYWEGTFKRPNLNLGTVGTKTALVMGNFGITGRLNILASIPYVETNATAGTLKGQKGFQDLSLALKWLFYENKSNKGTLHVFAVGRVSSPLTKYEPDFEPLSIGLHNRTGSIRGIVDYQYSVFYITTSASYVRQQNVTIDRNSYFTTSLHYTNEVQMPDAALYAFHAGYRSSRFIAELFGEQTKSLGGFDIRRNDMPFPSNRVDMTIGGVHFKYSFRSLKGLELTGGANYVFQGRNTGQSNLVHLGAYYLFKL